MQSRREFLGGVTLAGTAGLLGVRAGPAAADPPPETTKITILQGASLCQAPQYAAEELLRGEGFTQVEYLKRTGITPTFKALAAGEINVLMTFVGPLIMRVDAGDPIVMLAGAHVGCFELFGTERVRSIRDLKGKTVAVPSLESVPYVFLASMVAYVGLDPRKDVNWVTEPREVGMRLLAEGKIDAYLGFPPDPQELRARKIGHVVVSSSADRPWSQYFCCVIAANREFVRAHPIATRRALRAMLKMLDVCALEPDRVARMLVDRGLTKQFDYASQMMRDIPYARWREYNAEDTVRFWALRLHEAGMIKSSPQKIIAQGTDWRFLNELKKELKG